MFLKLHLLYSEKCGYKANIRFWSCFLNSLVLWYTDLQLKICKYILKNKEEKFAIRVILSDISALKRLKNL